MTREGAGCQLLTTGPVNRGDWISAPAYGLAGAYGVNQRRRRLRLRVSGSTQPPLNAQQAGPLDQLVAHRGDWTRLELFVREVEGNNAVLMELSQRVYANNHPQGS